jgi:hypothetical protein
MSRYPNYLNSFRRTTRVLNTKTCYPGKAGSKKS